MLLRLSEKQLYRNDNDKLGLEKTFSIYERVYRLDSTDDVRDQCLFVEAFPAVNTTSKVEETMKGIIHYAVDADVQINGDVALYVNGIPVAVIDRKNRVAYVGYTSLTRMELRPLVKEFILQYFDFKEADAAIPSLGMDPEFEIVVDGRVKRAVDYMLKDEYTEGGVGIDGSCDQAEFRPEPSTYPEVLVDNLKKIVVKAYEKLNSSNDRIFDFALSGNVYPLGCHIHSAWCMKPTSSDFETILKAIDKAFGDFVSLSGKARGEYKYRGAYRSNSAPYGDIFGWEYRSLPTIILYDLEEFTSMLHTYQELLKKLFKGQEVNVYPVHTHYYDMLAELLRTKNNRTILAPWIERTGIFYGYDCDFDDAIKADFESTFLRNFKRINNIKKIRIIGASVSRGDDYIDVIERESSIIIWLPYKFRTDKEFYNCNKHVVIDRIIAKYKNITNENTIKENNYE